MSEQQQQQAPKLSLRNLTTILRYWLKLIRARRDPIAFKQVVENLAQESNVPPKDIPVVHNALTAVREAAQAKQSAFVCALSGTIASIEPYLCQKLSVNRSVL